MKEKLFDNSTVLESLGKGRNELRAIWIVAG